MKNLITVLVLLITTVTFSQNKNTRVSFEVNGVCNMCKARIEKACIKTKGVKTAVWDVDTHELKVVFDERKTNVNTIEKNVAAAGHDTEHVKATDEAYNAISACCKYRDEDVVKSHQ